MGKDAKFEKVLDALLEPLNPLLEDIREAENKREENEKNRQEAYMGKIPYPIVDGKADHGSQNQTLKFYGDGRTYWEDKKKNLSSNNFPFEVIDLPLTETNYAYICENGICRPKDKAENGFSPVTKCPKYLGFRIDDSETRLYLYIGTLNDKGEFEFDDTYHIDTTNTGAVNHLRQSHNRFIQTDGDKELYFYYKINAGSKEKVTLVGCDEFPEGESDVIATTTTVVKNDGVLMATTAKYYSVILPSGCFYAVLNKKRMPTFLKPDTEDEETTSVPIFNVSYQTGVELVDGNEKPTIEINRGASFGVIPEGVGAALLRLPYTYELSDLRIYTDKLVKSNAKSGKRRKAKEIGEKLIKDFYFKSRKEIFWNDSVRPMKEGRIFYGVPYSSRWVNSHYLGFEVSAETVLNALNDPYSVAYDGGFVSADFDTDEKTGKEVPIKMYRDVPVSGHTEISGDEDKPEEYGGTGYGLVCSAFTNLICGNPYPQSNRGYTFDSNYVIENTVDMNSGEVLANKGLSHCVFVDEIYDAGFSLYEAVDPCVAKTTHTCLAEKTTYASSRVKTSTLDKYVYSIVNKDTSGYDRLPSLINLDIITIANGSVRPWRGNKAVYGSWDKTPKAEGRSFGGSGIGVTLHDGTTKFVLRYPSYTTKIIDKSDIECFAYFADNGKYADISSLITENGTYELYALNESGEKASESEFFRFYNHDTVQLTFDTEGKAVFKNSDGSVADDVEYIYVNVKGYGGAFGKDASLDQEGSGAMVIAKGKCYPDLALDTSRILDVRAAIVSDPAEDCWGKYSVATSPDVVSEYKVYESAVRGQVNQLSEKIDYVNDFVGCPENLFDANTFTTTNTSNWTISVNDDNDVIITHNTQWTTGSPIAPLSLEQGEYIFNITYEGATDVLYLYKDGTQVKKLTTSNVIAIEDGEYELRVIWNGSGSIALKDVSIRKNVVPLVEDLETIHLSIDQVYSEMITKKNYEKINNKVIKVSDGSLLGAGDTNCYVAKTDVIPQKKYIISGSTKYGFLYWAFYDAQGIMLQAGEKATGSGLTSIENKLVVAPENASSICVAYSTSSTIAKIETYEINNPKTKWSDKKWVCIGDSLTDAGNSTTTKRYFDYIAFDTGINVINMGVSGSGYARRSDDNNAFYQRVENIDTTSDAVTIFGSFNDLSAGLPIGTSSDTDVTTLGGCINKTIDVIQGKIPTVALGIVSPTPWETTKPTTSGNAYNYVNLLKEICELRSIPFLDLWRCSNLRPWNEDFRTLAYSKDGGAGTHPDETGHKIIAPKFKAFLETLII